jgi:hypothetical protein
MQEMKRKFRQLDEATRKLISKKLKGRKMSESHKVAISKGMKKYWANIPNKPLNNQLKNKEE